jgi:hypothetical protein
MGGESSLGTRWQRVDVLEINMWQVMHGVSTESHLLIAGEVSSIPISVWGGCWFKCGWLMAKTQQHEICSTQNWIGNAQGSEGHINFSQ